MVVLKPLYGITEAEIYQQVTYSKYYKKKLLIITFIFNPCFLIITIGTLFGIISIYINNIIILGDNQFSALKKDKLVKVNLIAKLKKKLSLTILLLFNRYILSLNKDSIALHQKGQGKKINIININSPKQGYVEQHAYRAYIASIYQPKASFNLSVTA